MVTRCKLCGCPDNPEKAEDCKDCGNPLQFDSRHTALEEEAPIGAAALILERAMPHKKSPPRLDLSGAIPGSVETPAKFKPGGGVIDVAVEYFWHLLPAITVILRRTARLLAGGAKMLFSLVAILVLAASTIFLKIAHRIKENRKVFFALLIAALMGWLYDRYSSQLPQLHNPVIAETPPATIVSPKPEQPITFTQTPPKESAQAITPSHVRKPTESQEWHRPLQKPRKPEFAEYVGDDGKVYKFDPRGTVKITGKVNNTSYRVEIKRARDGKIFWGTMRREQYSTYRQLH